MEQSATLPIFLARWVSETNKHFSRDQSFIRDRPWLRLPTVLLLISASTRLDALP
jgi:hypothetical protein